MKKIIIGLTAFILLGCTSLSVAKTIDVDFNKIKVIVNGQNVNADNVLIEGKTYIPLRAISEMLNKDVNWDGNTSTATITDKVVVSESSNNVNKDAKSSPTTSKSNVDLNLFNQYLSDIETQTNRKISDEQRNLLINWVSNNSINNLDKSITDERRKEFNKKKKSLLLEWGNHYNTTWTKYTENLVSKTSGKVLRQVGYNYEAHHIIELDYGGENAWYNLHPATFYEHQNIHRKGSIGNQLFSENVGE